jgi:hypothetical protein
MKMSNNKEDRKPATGVINLLGRGVASRRGERGPIKRKLE